jgi:hypothetical protein
MQQDMVQLLGSNAAIARAGSQSTSRTSTYLSLDKATIVGKLEPHDLILPLIKATLLPTGNPGERCASTIA